MAKRFNQLTQLTAAQLAQNDIIPIRDESAGQTKYITVKDLTGSPDLGWTATAESWAYSSWNSTLLTGVITVPTDATTKYAVGMWVRFSQTTGGTKYGKIIAVTTTTITVDFPNGTTLTNEAITSPVYSPLARPVGVPSDTLFVHTYTQSGSGGGTGYFKNESGVKRCWGLSGSFSGGGNTGPTQSFPTGFFAAIQFAATWAYNSQNTTIPGNWTQNSITTSGTQSFSGGTAGTTQQQWLAIGT